MPLAITMLWSPPRCWGCPNAPPGFGAGVHLALQIAMLVLSAKPQRNRLAGPKHPISMDLSA